MQPLPHHYAVAATARAEGSVSLVTEEGAELACSPPAAFGGVVGVQSPEYLLAEAVAGCYILSFRALAANRLAWSDIACDATGTLDKSDGRMAFTEFHLQARLRIPADASADQARRLLEKAEQICLVSASLACPVHLEASVVVDH